VRTDRVRCRRIERGRKDSGPQIQIIAPRPASYHAGDRPLRVRVRVAPGIRRVHEIVTVRRDRDVSRRFRVSAKTVQGQLATEINDVVSIRSSIGVSGTDTYYGVSQNEINDGLWSSGSPTRATARPTSAPPVRRQPGPRWT
jgi:hypothetical protein